MLPVSAPGLWKKVPGYLADPLGPVTLRWRYLPKALPWLWRFLRAGSTAAKVRQTASALRPLVHRAPDLHRKLAEEAGVADLIHKTGLLYIFPSRADFEAESLSWTIRHEQGIRWIELNADELRQREPSLARRYTFGVFVEEGGHCTDPGAYVAALVRHAAALGANIVAARATGFRISAGRLQAVETSAGPILADRAVIAAGAWSKHLAALAGDEVPLETERGYHAMITNPESAPRYPIMPSDTKTATVATANGLRIAGQVEIAGLDAAPNWRRAELLRDFALAAYPGLPRDLPADRVKVWMGHRPSTPDGLPCIGPASGCADVVHAFGHGHIGLASGAFSGRLVADIIGGKPPATDPAPYAPQRFR